MKVLLAALFCLLAAPALAEQRIAITFDDLPSHSSLPSSTTRVQIAVDIIAALKAANAPPAWGFINGARLEDDPASAPVLKLWRDAGYPLGNHTFSHTNLNTVTPQVWEADLLKNEPLLKSLMPGRNWRWLRYPYLAEGETVLKHDTIRRRLAVHGYRIAAVTMSFDDYYWNEPYARCVARNDADAIAAMETAWLKAADVSLAYYHDLSQQLYRRDIPYVLLMHVGGFSARMLPRLLDLYRERGVKLITLEEAMRDPFYRADANPWHHAQPTTLEQAMAARGMSYYPARVAKVMPFETLCR